MSDGAGHVHRSGRTGIRSPAGQHRQYPLDVIAELLCCAMAVPITPMDAPITAVGIVLAVQRQIADRDLSEFEVIGCDADQRLRIVRSSVGSE